MSAGVALHLCDDAVRTFETICLSVGVHSPSSLGVSLCLSGSPCLYLYHYFVYFGYYNYWFLHDSFVRLFSHLNGWPGVIVLLASTWIPFIVKMPACCKGTMVFSDPITVTLLVTWLLRPHQARTHYPNPIFKCILRSPLLCLKTRCHTLVVNYLLNTAEWIQWFMYITNKNKQQDYSMWSGAKVMINGL